MCEEFSQCFDVGDVNFCLWTNGSLLSQQEARAACQQRNNSFLPRIPDRYFQAKLAEFGNNALSLLGRNHGFWIDVQKHNIDHFHWLDGSLLAGQWHDYVTTKHSNVWNV